MSAVVEDLLLDLDAEYAALTAALTGLPEAVWDVPTPATGWSVRDQITHLAYFDHLTMQAILDPATFAEVRDNAMLDLQVFVTAASRAGDGKSGVEMLDWWEHEHGGLVQALRAADPSIRVPWFGASMGLASKASARLMETWAHGQDVVDALRLQREPTSRLRHVARLGFMAFANSFRTRDLPVPEVPVRVDLLAPDGQTWSWGPIDAPDQVTGTALDFCLVVTQRRHRVDTGLTTTGETAAALDDDRPGFPGPPGKGRSVGQFSD